MFKTFLFAAIIEFEWNWKHVLVYIKQGEAFSAIKRVLKMITDFIIALLIMPIAVPIITIGTRLAPEDPSMVLDYDRIIKEYQHDIDYLNYELSR